MNQAMARKLASGEAVDVEKVGEVARTEGPGVWHLRDFHADVDYCVGSSEAWIWSIGRRRSDGAIFAATDNRFYQNPAFECLWLR